MSQSGISRMVLSLWIDLDCFLLCWDRPGVHDFCSAFLLLFCLSASSSSAKMIKKLEALDLLNLSSSHTSKRYFGTMWCQTYLGITQALRHLRLAGRDRLVCISSFLKWTRTLCFFETWMSSNSSDYRPNLGSTTSGFISCNCHLDSFKLESVYPILKQRGVKLRRFEVVSFSKLVFPTSCP